MPAWWDKLLRRNDLGKTTPLITEIARSFTSLVRGIDPKWRRAYLRVASQHSMSEAKGSYVHPSGVEIIDVMKHKEFFHPVKGRAQELLIAMGKTEGLILLVVDATLDYEFKCEYQDMSRWRISKLGGGTGIPEGIE